MPGFKEQMALDRAVFFNADEFADFHNINGRDLLIIIDDYRLQERSKKEYDGISVGEILYFVKAEDYGKRPEEGTPQIFDGRQLLVFDAREDLGIYEIILKQNRGV